ncbi:MAG TPA: hypothetical protein VGA13_04090 [Acidimicrobiales bacterium]
MAETVRIVLESFYEAPRVQVADAMRSLIAFDSVVVVGQAIDGDRQRRRRSGFGSGSRRSE